MNPESLNYLHIMVIIYLLLSNNVIIYCNKKGPPGLTALFLTEGLPVWRPTFETIISFFLGEF